ncbi:MAG: PAS domain S-box protein, partial [Gemmatimonadetes bacterium]|nr:PAS domain S-box protein [Gemmatimonadota bacterium]
MAHTVFLVAYFAMPLVAWLLVGRLETWLLLPLVFFASAVFFLLHWRRLQREAGVQDRLPYQDVERIVRELASTPAPAPPREDHHLQLLGLGELWKAVAQSKNPQDVFDGILSYCQRRGGFSEVAVLLVEPASEELVGTWSLPVDQGTHLRRVRWSLRGLGGGVATVLRTAHAVRIAEVETSPLLRVNGERPEPRTNHGSYLAVPILSPLPRPECLDEGWLYNHDCPAFQPVSGFGEPRPQRDGLDLGPCFRCRHYPLHGVLLVTDMNRNQPIRDEDQQLVETLAATIAAVLDHAALFRGVRAEERFRNQILDAMSNGLVTTDPRGRVVFANRRALEMVGKSEIVGEPLSARIEFLSSSDPLQRALFEGRESNHLEGFLKATDRRIPIRVNVGPYRRQSGGHRGVVCVFADMSGEKAMEEEIRHLDTLAAVGRFASSLAHEIRNPLGGISAGVGYLARSVQMEEDADSRENMRVIQSEIERLDGIIRNLLVVARPKEVELRPCDPVSLVRQATRALEPWAREERVALEVTVCTIEPWPYLDRDMIHQVLINLIKNAVE